jgi:hypothetical protein
MLNDELNSKLTRNQQQTDMVTKSKIKDLKISRKQQEIHQKTE